MHGLDRIDLHILNLLQSDGALSNKTLARLVSLSPSACSERVKRLERDSIIERYTALLDPGAFEGAIEGWAEIILRQRTSAVMESIVQVLKGADIVVDIYELTGHFDLIVRFVAPDIEDWRAIERRLEQAAPEIASIRHALVAARMIMRPMPVARLAKTDRGR